MGMQSTTRVRERHYISDFNVSVLDMAAASAEGEVTGTTVILLMHRVGDRQCVNTPDEQLASGSNWLPFWFTSFACSVSDTSRARSTRLRLLGSRRERSRSLVTLLRSVSAPQCGPPRTDAEGLSERRRRHGHNKSDCRTWRRAETRSLSSGGIPVRLLQRQAPCMKSEAELVETRSRAMFWYDQAAMANHDVARTTLPWPSRRPRSSAIAAHRGSSAPSLGGGRQRGRSATDKLRAHFQEQC